MKEFVLYILYHDFFYYFTHRLLHSRYFYPLHKIHHKKINPEYYDFYSVHIVEIPISSIGLFIAIYLHKLYMYQVVCAILYIHIRGLMAHDARCTQFVGDHHLLHHKLIKCNYGEYWLDAIFGTLHTNNSPSKYAIGLAGCTRCFNARSLG